ncbi:MAG: SMC-Scp complex subunit ScpB, partial [Bradymonadaceae bacterium]
MSSQHDDNDNRPNIPTPETHGPSTNAPGPPEQSSQVDLPDDERPEDGAADAERNRLSKVDRLQASLEAILLAADGPLSRDDLVEAFDETAPEVVDRVLKRIELEFSGPARGIHLVRVAGGYELRTNPTYDARVR